MVLKGEKNYDSENWEDLFIRLAFCIVRIDAIWKQRETVQINDLDLYGSL